jgi:hypothetical protein
MRELTEIAPMLVAALPTIYYYLFFMDFTDYYSQSVTLRLTSYRVQVNN